MRRTFACVFAAAVAAVMAMASVTPVFAHEVRQVGAYTFTVGWQHEPTYVGVENAVQVFIHDSRGRAVADLADRDLKVTIATSGQTSGSLNLTASYDPDTGLGIPGEYDAALLPTAPGTYSFHITGAVHGQSIDQTFTSSDSTFDDVKDPSPIEFPATQPTATELGQLSTKLQARVTTLESQLVAARSSVTTAQDAANRDQIFALAAGAIGLVGLVLAVVAMRRRT